MSDEIRALEAEIKLLQKDMKPKYVKAAYALAEGKTQEQAYEATGGRAKRKGPAASEMLKLNPNISQLSQLLKQLSSAKAKASLIATADQKRKLLWDVAQRCAQEVEMAYEGSGEDKQPIGYAFEYRGVVSAIAELNKMDGDLAAIKTENKHNHALSDLSDEALDERITELLKQFPELAAVLTRQ